MFTGINGFGNASLFQNTGISARKNREKTENDYTQSTHPDGWDGKYNGGSVSSAGGMLTMTDFYTILAAQLKYQDADNPMDTSEMMAQMVQSQMIQTITQLSEVTVTTYAASMAGKEVTVAEVDINGKYTGKNTVGVVESVVFSGATPVLYINGKSYTMSQLMAVGKIPETEKPEKPEEGGDAQKPGEGEDVQKPEEDENAQKPGEGEGVQKPEEGGETQKPETGEPANPGGNEGEDSGLSGQGQTVSELLQSRMGAL